MSMHTRNGSMPAAIIGALLLLIAYPALTAPPTIVSITPDHGDILVDPALAEIRVTFDQDMDTGGWSWTGGGETFPPLDGQPRWIDGRTCVLPVKLEPRKLYAFGINGDRATKFRNPAGEPVAPCRVMFTTAPGEGERPDDALDETVNRESIAMLRAAIADRYSYRDRLGLDWEALFAEHEAEMLRATRPIEFALRASLLLARAEDLHMSIVAEGQWMQPHAFDGQRNYNFEAVQRRLDEFGAPNDLVQRGRVGDIGYLRINSWDGRRAEQLAMSLEIMREFQERGLPAVIIDVRANGGGNEALARRLAGCFITEETVYSKHVFVDPEQPGGFGPMGERTFAPAPDVPTYEGDVAVLIGPVVCSSNESFVAMMDQVPNCTLIGMTTYGSSGNPQPHELPNGVTVRLPSWQDYLADGTLLEGRGIEPDVPVETAPADFRNADPVFDRAVAYLREKQRE